MELKFAPGFLVRSALSLVAEYQFVNHSVGLNPFDGGLDAIAFSASAMTGSVPLSFNRAGSGGRISANISCWFALRRRTSGLPIAPLAPAIRILIALRFQLAVRRLEARRKSCSASSTPNASGRPSSDKAFSHPINCRAASRSLVVDRGLGAVIGDDVGDHPLWHARGHALVGLSIPKWDRQFRLVRVHHEHREELGRLGLACIGADAVAVAGQFGEALSGLVGCHRPVVDLTADSAAPIFSMRRLGAFGHRAEQPPMRFQV